ncbi:MAG: hypothetical protein ACXVII_33345 [Solirubrobacteraceae bacterium]
MGTRCRLHLVDRGETLSGKTVGDTHKIWPDSAVDQGDFSVDQARRDHVVLGVGTLFYGLATLTELIVGGQLADVLAA